MDFETTTNQLRRVYETHASKPSKRDGYHEPKWDAVVVRRLVSIDDFLEWLEDNEDDCQFHRWVYEPYDMGGYGRVTVSSMLTPVHIQTTSAVISSIRDQLVHLGRSPALDAALRQPVSLVCRLGDRLQKPDDALVPADAPKCSPPTFVVEVAYLNESIVDLQSRLARWIADTTAVQVAVGVKVYASSKRILVLMQRGLSTQFIEFGGRSRAHTAACFPVGAVFRGFNVPVSLRKHQRELIEIDANDLHDVVEQAKLSMRRKEPKTIS